jgi:hypothetical protein
VSNPLLALLQNSCSSEQELALMQMTAVLNYL